MIRAVFPFTLAYAIILILLGYMGYTAGSIISLIVSGSLGLLILGALTLTVLTQRPWPYYVIMTVLAFLLAFFGYRFATSKSFISGAMFVFTFLILSIVSIKVFSHREL